MDDSKPIKLMFAGLGKDKWCVAAKGEQSGDALDMGPHVEDIFASKEELPEAGLVVFAGTSYWTPGTYEYPYDCDFILEGKWRIATTEEITLFAEGEDPWH